MMIMNENEHYSSETELWSTLRTTRSAKAGLNNPIHMEVSSELLNNRIWSEDFYSFVTY